MPWRSDDTGNVSRYLWTSVLFELVDASGMHFSRMFCGFQTSKGGLFRWPCTIRSYVDKYFQQPGLSQVSKTLERQNLPADVTET